MHKAPEDSKLLQLSFNDSAVVKSSSMTDYFLFKTYLFVPYKLGWLLMLI